MNVKLSKKMIITFTLCVVAILAIPTTFAFFRTNDAIANEFLLDTVDIEIVEEFTPPKDWDGTPVTKEVQIQNNGSEATLIRVGLTPYWQKAIANTDPVEYEAFAGDSSKIEITYENLTTSATTTDPGKWFLAADGYYYYNQLVPAGKTTTLLISGVKLNTAGMDEATKKRYQAAEFNLDVDAQAVHANADAVSGVWGSLGSDVQPLIDALIPATN
ncbi:MAG: BsaA family SipW-dependent biofilm matrix protein [Culicoidibacterales bacterium]